MTNLADHPDRPSVHERRVELGSAASGKLALVYRTTNPARDSEDCYLVQDNGATSSEIYLGPLLPYDATDLRNVLNGIADRAEDAFSR